MRNTSAKNNSDMKCIWMVAGIINYKLCDQNFECEKCDFNKVMQGKKLVDKSGAELQNGGTKTENKNIDEATSRVINQYLYALFSDCNIHLDRYFHPSNFWFNIETENRVSVGVDKLFIKIMEPVDRIILPAENKTYDQNQMIAILVRKGQTLPLISPVRGTVVELNEIFLQNRLENAIKSDKYLFKMEAPGIIHEVQQMCNNVVGLQCFSQKVNLVRDYLTSAFEQTRPQELGTTLADGGIFQTELEKVIGETAFRELLARLLPGMEKFENDVNSI